MRLAAARKWAEALRSGEYEQVKELERFVPTVGRVRHDPIGVLGEIAQDGLHENGVKREIFREMFREVEEGVAYCISDWAGVRKWSGLDPGAEYGRGKDGEMLELVAKMNDEGKSFQEIAGVIELAYDSF